MDGIELVVTSEFGGFKIGDVITDPVKVAAVLAGENETSVVKRKALAAPAPVEKKP